MNLVPHLFWKTIMTRDFPQADIQLLSITWKGLLQAQKASEMTSYEWDMAMCLCSIYAGVG